jgi:hypothetical protein
MDTDQLSKLLQSLEERIIKRIDKQEERVKKLRDSTGVGFKALNEKLEELESMVEKSSEKTAKPKREQSDGQKAWIAFVKEVWDELKEDDPKASYKDAMSEASKRKDMDDPAGAKKRAEARAKRIEAKEKKSAKSSKATSDTESSEEEKPKKKKEEKPKKKEEKPKKKGKKEALHSDSDSD